MLNISGFWSDLIYLRFLSPHFHLVLSDTDPVERHADFHLFAAMNPSTDVGKRELPQGLRNRFTEYFVPELDPRQACTTVGGDEPLVEAASTDASDLAIIVKTYLVSLNPSSGMIAPVVRLYGALRQAASEGLVDGVGHRPHFR